MKTIVTYRFTPCNCGCKGTDPWHRATYRRVIRDVSEASGQAVVRGLGSGVEYFAVGVVDLPFSDEPVRVVRLKYGIWAVDYGSIKWKG